MWPRREDAASISTAEPHRSFAGMSGEEIDCKHVFRVLPPRTRLARHLPALDLERQVRRRNRVPDARSCVVHAQPRDPRRDLLSACRPSVHARPRTDRGRIALCDDRDRRAEAPALLDRTLDSNVRGARRDVARLERGDARRHPALHAIAGQSTVQLRRPWPAALRRRHLVRLDAGTWRAPFPREGRRSFAQQRMGGRGVQELRGLRRDAGIRRGARAAPRASGELDVRRDVRRSRMVAMPSPDRCRLCDHARIPRTSHLHQHERPARDANTLRASRSASRHVAISSRHAGVARISSSTYGNTPPAVK